MAAYDLEEQEQLAQLKHWWARYGNMITGLLVAAAIVVTGWQTWNWYQRKQSAAASALYAAVQKAASERDAKAAREAAGELVEKFSGTSYAALATLLSARVQFDAGDLKTARTQLAWAAEHAKDPALADLARMRLAVVMLDERAFDEALKQLEREPVAALAARYAELRGDIHAAQGKPKEARAAYQAALVKLEGGPQPGAASQVDGAAREIVQLKLDSLGEAG